MFPFSDDRVGLQEPLKLGLPNDGDLTSTAPICPVVGVGHHVLSALLPIRQGITIQKRHRFAWRCRKCID